MPYSEAINIKILQVFHNTLFMYMGKAIPTNPILPIFGQTTYNNNKVIRTKTFAIIELYRYSKINNYSVWEVPNKDRFQPITITVEWGRIF